MFLPALPSSYPVSVLSLALVGRLFDELSLLQYCGALADILILPCSYSGSSSISLMLISVSFFISLAYVRANLRGEVAGREIS